MQRKLHFRGDINEQSLVIGNHGNAHLIIDGKFNIRGLVYCPRYELIVTIKGQGEIELHGICKKIKIRRVTGACEIDFSDLRSTDMICRGLFGNTTLRVSHLQTISEREMGAQAIIKRVNKTVQQVETVEYIS